MPTSSATWPALWLLDNSSTWPLSGEIDGLEGSNNMTSNRMSLHTKASVKISNGTSTIANGSTINTLNCDANDPTQGKNMGLLVDQPEGTLGKPFNDNRGSVLAPEYTSQGIKMWQFPRNNLPAGGNFNDPQSTANWPLPNADFTGNNVNYDDFFCDMQLIIDTTFCGWVGQDWAKKHASLAPTCEDYVTRKPSRHTGPYMGSKSSSRLTTPIQTTAPPQHHCQKLPAQIQARQEKLVSRC